MHSFCEKREKADCLITYIVSFYVLNSEDNIVSLNTLCEFLKVLGT